MSSSHRDRLSSVSVCTCSNVQVRGPVEMLRVSSLVCVAGNG